MNREGFRFNSRDFEPIKEVALSFPETEESVSHEGTPSVKVRGKLMCRLHESGAFISIRLDYHWRDEYLASHPEIFLLPEHFRHYPYICLATSGYTKKILKEVLEHSWRALASKKAIKEYDAP